MLNLVLYTGIYSNEYNVAFRRSCLVPIQKASVALIYHTAMNNIKTKVIADSKCAQEIVNKIVKHSVTRCSIGNCYQVIQDGINEYPTDTIIIRLESLPNGTSVAAAGYKNKKGTIRYIESGLFPDPDTCAKGLVCTLVLCEDLGDCDNIVIR